MSFETDLYLPKINIEKRSNRLKLVAQCQQLSVWLNTLSQTYPDVVEDFLNHGPDIILKQIEQRQHDFSSKNFQDFNRLQQALIQHKQQLSLILGWLEISGYMPVLRTARLWSNFAALALQITLKNVMLQLYQKKQLNAPSDPCKGIGIIAMGKNFQL
ncbi:MAG: hypothetical protein AAF403_08585, partial [Pseudomonadota bacterium]